MEFGDKLKELRKSQGLTQAQVAEKVPTSRVSYYQWEKGDKRPTPMNLERLAKIFKVSSLYLKDDDEAGLLLNEYIKLNPLRKRRVVDYAKAQVKEQEERKTPLIQEARTLYQIKVYEKASAGLGVGIIGDGDYSVVLTDEKPPQYDLATFVEGESMNRDFNDRSVILLRNTNFDYDGAIYVIYLPDENTSYVKRIFREKEGLRLVSSNPNFPDKFVYFEENPYIVGKVIDSFEPLVDF